MTPAPARFSRTGSTPQPSPRGTPYDPPTRQSPHSFQPFDTTHLGNCAATGIDQLAKLVRTRLKRLQYRPELLDGFLGQTGLTLQPIPP